MHVDTNARQNAWPKSPIGTVRPKPRDIMTRYLVIRTQSELVWLRISKNARPLTLWKGRLFRTDERLMVRDKAGKNEVVLYDIDGIEPYGASIMVDPDETMALIDIAKTNKGRSVSKIDALNRLDSKVYMYAIVGIVLVYALLTGGIV